MEDDVPRRARQRRQKTPRTKRRDQAGGGSGLLSAFGQAFRNFLSDDGAFEEALGDSITTNQHRGATPSGPEAVVVVEASAAETARSENEKLRGLLSHRTQMHRLEMQDRQDEISALNDTVAMLRNELRERIEARSAVATSAHKGNAPAHNDSDKAAAEAAEAEATKQRKQQAALEEMHTRECESIRAEHEAKMAKLTAEHDACVTRLRAEHDAAFAKVTAEKNARESKLTSEHEAAISKIREEEAARESKLTSEHEATIAKIRDELSREPEVDALKADLAELRAQEVRLRTELDASRRELSASTVSAASAAADAVKAREEHAKEVEDMRAAKMKAREEHAKEVEDIKAECVNGIRSLQAGHVDAMRRLRDDMTREHEDAVRDIRAKLAHEMAERRRLHNELVDAKGNIRVFVRIRPPANLGTATTINDDGSGNVGALEVFGDGKDDDARVRVLPPPERAMLDKGMEYTGFARVFSHATTQTFVFAEIQPLVRSVLDGFNVTVMAYGQTGSGKTHTMEGTSADRGVNTRAIHELFAMAEEMRTNATPGEPKPEVGVSVSYLEIYNETLRDLLASSDDKASKPGGSSAKLEIRHTERSGVEVPGLSVRKIENPAECFAVLDEGRQNRATAATNMNLHSSRSHALLTVYVSVTTSTAAGSTGEAKKQLKRVSKLHLIDLAGSERVAKSGVEDARLREATAINKSLSAISDVVMSLQKKTSHVPYRNSKLTHFLQDSLGGNSKMVMFVMLSCDMENVSESISSLSFASRVQTVELGQARKQKTVAH